MKKLSLSLLLTVLSTNTAFGYALNEEERTLNLTYPAMIEGNSSEYTSFRGERMLATGALVTFEPIALSRASSALSNLSAHNRQDIPSSKIQVLEPGNAVGCFGGTESIVFEVDSDFVRQDGQYLKVPQIRFQTSSPLNGPCAALGKALLSKSTVSLSIKDAPYQYKTETGVTESGTIDEVVLVLN